MLTVLNVKWVEVIAFRQFLQFIAFAFVERMPVHICTILIAITMATVMQIQGWRCYFTSNEAEEPMHVYAQKGQSETKFWLHADQYVVEEDFEHNLTARGRREIRKLVYI